MIDTVIFDLDGTLVRYHGVNFESSWGAIARAAGIIEQSKELFEKYFHQQDSYAEWASEEVKLLAGIPVAKVAEQVLPAPYAAGVRAAIEALRPSYRLGILSSGVNLVADWVCSDLELEFVRSNLVHVEAGKFTGFTDTVVDLWSKGEVLQTLAQEHAFELSSVCFVGDNVNDLPAMKLAGLSVAANPKNPQVRDAADHVIEDFTELPPLIEAFNASLVR